MTQRLFIWIFIVLLSISCQETSTSNLSLLSDQIPVDDPIKFAPGIISTDNHLEASITFSPDMTELFFNRRKATESHNLHTMKLVDEKWTQPVLASFSKNKEYLDFHPRISPKGDVLYFGSTRPLKDSINSSGLHQWYVNKDMNRWGQPIVMENPFIDRFIMCTTPAENGNIYFNSKEQGDKLEDEGIYYAVNQSGQYHSIIKMDSTINYPGKWIAHPYIAPDESYIIYDAERTPIPDNGDLFISFRIDGSWTKSYDLGPQINTGLSEGAATVSPDGKFLFFSRSQEKIAEDGSTYWSGDIYWTDFTQLKKELLEKHNL